MPRFDRLARVEQRRLLEVLRVARRPYRRAEADAVGSLHRFDLDDVGTHRGEPRGRERPRPERGEVEHPHSGERTLTGRAVRRAPIGIRTRRPRRRSGLGTSGCRFERAIFDGVKAERCPRSHERGTGLRHEHVARPQLLELWEQLAVPHQRDGNPCRAARGLDLLGRVRPGPVVQQLVDLDGAHEAADHRAELVVVGEVVTTHRVEQRAPLRRGDGRDADEATVGGRLVAGNHDEAEGRAPPTGKVRHQCRHREHRELHGLELRDVDELGPTRSRRPAPRGCRAQRRERPADVLTEATADGQRRLSHVAVARQRAGTGLQHRFRQVETVVGPTVADGRELDDDERPRSRLAGSGPRAETGDELGIETGRSGVGEQHDVGLGHQRRRITSERALRRAQIRVQRAVRIFPTERVATGRFPVHDSTTEIGEELRRVGASEPGRQVDHAQVVVDHARPGGARS